MDEQKLWLKEYYYTGLYKIIKQLNEEYQFKIGTVIIPHELYNVMLQAKIYKILPKLKQSLNIQNNNKLCSYFYKNFKNNSQLLALYTYFQNYVDINKNDILFLNVSPNYILQTKRKHDDDDDNVDDDTKKFKINFDKTVCISKFENDIYSKEEICKNSDKLILYTDKSSIREYLVNNLDMCGKQNSNLAVLLKTYKLTPNDIQELFKSKSVMNNNQLIKLNLPKYDLDQLRPYRPLFMSTISCRQILYWYLNKTSFTEDTLIPEHILKYSNLFLAFPFYCGYLISTNKQRIELITTINILNDLKIREIVLPSSFKFCEFYELTYYKQELLAKYTYNEILKTAILTKDFMTRAIMIILLYTHHNYLNVNYIIINYQKIFLASELSIMNWIKLANECHYCDEEKIILLNNNIELNTPTNYINKYIHLIKTISTKATSKNNACILCTYYILPEFIWNYVYQELVDANDLYIFYTLILQKCNNQIYWEARSKLKNVTFCNNNNCKISTTTFCANAINPSKMIIQPQLFSAASYITPNIVENNKDDLNIYDIIDNDKKILTNKQTATFITLMLVNAHINEAINQNG